MSQASEQIASQFSSAAGNRKAWYNLVYNVKDPVYGATGDGLTDDTTAIQAAIDAIGSAGTGILWFPAGGTYLSTKLNGVSNMTIMGYGAKLKLKNATNNTMLEFASKSNVRIFGLELDGNKANQTIFGPLLGLAFFDCTDIHIEDCIGHDVNGIAFGHNCIKRGKLLNNHAYNNADNGVDFNGDFTTVPRVNQGNTYVEMSGNVCHDNGQNGIFFGHGICKYSLIHDNLVYNNTGVGLLTGESSSSTTVTDSFSQNEIRSNIVVKNGGGGIFSYTPNHCKFIDNICNDNTGIGMRLSRVVSGQPFPQHNQVFGNECANIDTTNQTHGILIDGNGNLNEIKNNTCLANTTVDILRSGASDVVYQNRVTGGYQEKTGTVTTGSIAGGATGAVTVNLTGYTSTPDILLTITASTGHEKFIAKVDSPTNATFNIRVVNLDGAIAGTATVRWKTNGGI